VVDPSISSNLTLAAFYRPQCDAKKANERFDTFDDDVRIDAVVPGSNAAIRCHDEWFGLSASFALIAALASASRGE
jgi:hypothetical protein